MHCLPKRVSPNITLLATAVHWEWRLRSKEIAKVAHGTKGCVRRVLIDFAVDNRLAVGIALERLRQKQLAEVMPWA